MFYSASAFDQDISRGPVRVHDGANRHVSRRRLRFEAKFACSERRHDGPANSCTLPEPILDANWHAYVAECLAIAPMDGLCTSWDKYGAHGAMPNWDTSLVDGYEWMDWKCFSRLWR